MKNFRTYNLAVKFYHLADALKLQGTLKDQLVRAASSIVLNLAEGSGKLTKKDQLKFFYIAMGSLRECQAILTIARLESSAAWQKLDSLGAHLFRLIQHAA